LKNKNIIFINTQSYGQSGGIAEFNRNFIDALKSSRLIGDLYNLSLLDDNSSIKFFKYKIFIKIYFIFKTLGFFFKKSEIVICGHVNLLFLCAVVAIIKRNKLILIMHGVEVWNISHFRAFMVNYFVDHYLSVSKHTQYKYEKRLQKQIDCSLVYNSVDLKKFYPGAKRLDLLNRVELEIDDKIIFFLGRLDANEAYKGVDELISAVNKLRKNDSSIKLLICGDGTDKVRLNKKVVNLNLEKYVKFSGYVAQDEIADFFRLADCFAMPGSGEGFGIVYLEAIACGIPTIGSIKDGSKEALLNGKLGFLIDPSNIDQLCKYINISIQEEKVVKEEINFYSRESFYLRVKKVFQKIFEELN
jgi:phosphatidyl-myo-inositol dimannoside synthase